MGISDRHYFPWLCGALRQFDAESGRLSAMRGRREPCTLWVLAGSSPNAPIELLRDLLGRGSTTVRYLDRFSGGSEVVRADFNALDAVPDDSCDVLLMTRASYMVEAPERFLAHARRSVRSSGLMIVDWLHGSSDAPVLDLPGRHEYEGRSVPFRTTYCDPQFLADFPDEFGALIRHVNRPPWWANVERPGTPLPLRVRIARALGGGPRRHVTPGSYLDVYRAELARAAKHLIEPTLMEQYFKVVFRHARYFYRHVGKFNLYLRTVLEPVGK